MVVRVSVLAVVCVLFQTLLRECNVTSVSMHFIALVLLDRLHVCH